MLHDISFWFTISNYVSYCFRILLREKTLIAAALWEKKLNYIIILCLLWVFSGEILYLYLKFCCRGQNLKSIGIRAVGDSTSVRWELRGWLSDTPALYVGGPRFRCCSRNQISWGGVSWFSSVPKVNYRLVPQIVHDHFHILSSWLVILFCSFNLYSVLYWHCPCIRHICNVTTSGIAELPDVPLKLSATS